MVEGGSHHELEFYSKLQAPTVLALCHEGQSKQEGKDAAPGAPAQALAPGGARPEGRSGSHQRRDAGAQLSALRLAGVALPDSVPVQAQKVTPVTPEVSSNFTSTAGSLQPSCSATVLVVEASAQSISVAPFCLCL